VPWPEKRSMCLRPSASIRMSFSPLTMQGEGVFGAVPRGEEDGPSVWGCLVVMVLYPLPMGFDLVGCRGHAGVGMYDALPEVG